MPDDVWLTAYRSRTVHGGAGSWVGAALFLVLGAYVGKELLDPRPVIRVDADGVRLRSPRCDLRWFEIEAVQLHVRRTATEVLFAIGAVAAILHPDVLPLPPASAVLVRP